MESVVQRVEGEVVAEGESWTLRRILVERTPLLGTIIHTGERWHTRVVGEGGVVLGTSTAIVILGPGHQIELPPHSSFLYVPLGRLVPFKEWVLYRSTKEASPGEPEIARMGFPGKTIPIPTREDTEISYCAPRVRPWAGIPGEVAEWADWIGVRPTSLTQRLKRLVGESPKQILGGLRATLAFESIANYQGQGSLLALDMGYSSHSHFSSDMKKRFGVSLTEVMSDKARRQLDWIRLLRSVAR